MRKLNLLEVSQQFLSVKLDVESVCNISDTAIQRRPYEKRSKMECGKSTRNRILFILVQEEARAQFIFQVDCLQ